MMNEREIAIKEGAMVAAEDAYFEARTQLDCVETRRTFEAGFVRAWDKARPAHPFGLEDEQIDAIAEQMPGGMDGFLKHWGWRQFARAIEKAHGIGGIE